MGVSKQAHGKFSVAPMMDWTDRHDRAFLRALSNRVIELGGESGTDAEPHLYTGSYVEYVARTGHEAPGVHT